MRALAGDGRPRRRPRGPALVLVTVGIAFLAVVVGAPVALVFAEAFARGWRAYASAIAEPDALSALRLTLLTVAIVVPANTLFGLAAAWALARFEFRGRRALVTLIDLPLAVSPVVSGLVFVLLFGRSGLFGPWLTAHHVQVIFALPGIVLATAFVTLPLVAREVIPVLEAAGREEEEAARLLGAGPWRTFFRITLPNIKWGVVYGAILCGARAMGEFGAVSVVSGHIRGRTNTLPLHVEILYNEYRFQAAFAVASLLVLVAVVTLVSRRVVERRSARARVGAASAAEARDREAA